MLPFPFQICPTLPLFFSLPNGSLVKINLSDIRRAQYSFAFPVFDCFLSGLQIKFNAFEQQNSYECFLALQRIVQISQN